MKGDMTKEEMKKIINRKLVILEVLGQEKLSRKTLTELEEIVNGLDTQIEEVQKTGGIVT